MAASILERFYWVDPPQEVRSKPMKVLALGISRSGTESLSKALEQLGYETYHPHKKLIHYNDLSEIVAWTQASRAKFGGLTPADGAAALDTKFFDTILGPYDAVCGFPGQAFPRELMIAYPEAKVILNTRDVDAWWDSFSGPVLRAIRVRSSLLARFVFSLSQTGYWQARLLDLVFAYWRVDRGNGFTESKCKWIYEEHSALIRGLVPEERLLEWKVGDGYESICRFLGDPVPESAFPHGNTREEMDAKMKAVTKTVLAEALRNLLIISAGSIAAGAAIATVIFRYRLFKRR